MEAGFPNASIDRSFVHPAFPLRDHFRNGGVVARRHNVNAGDAGNGRKLVDQVDADADAFAHGVRGLVHTCDECIGDDGAEQVAFHPLRRFGRAERIDADKDGELCVSPALASTPI